MWDLTFNPLNFLGGLALATAFFVVKDVVNSRLSGKARTNVWDNFNENLNKLRRAYALYVDRLDVIGSTRDEVQDKFTHAFPSYSFDASFNASLVNKTHQDLNNFLLMMNEADNFPSDTKSSLLSKHIDKLKKASTDLDWMMNCSANSIKNFSQQLDTNLKRKSSSLEKQALYQKRFKIMSETFSEMRKNFAPVFLEKVPSTIYAAEKELNSYNSYVDDTHNKFMHYYDNDADYDNYPLNKAFESAEKALLPVSDFMSTVMNQTATYRAILGRMTIQTPVQQQAYDAALESLVQAELTVYDSGNPHETFTKITQPFLDFATENQLIDGIVLNS